MNFRQILLAACITFPFSYRVLAQTTNESRFLPNDINDRLPHSDINSIIQDRFGFLWFATYSGLCKYDGKNLSVFDRESGNPNSLSSSRILSLEELRDGSILVGTEGGGINHYFPASQSFKVYRNGQAANTISGDVINAIHQTSNGAIWIGTNSGLDLMQLRDDTVRFEKVFNSPLGVSTIAEDKEGNLIFSSGLRLFEIKKGAKYYTLKFEFDSGIKSILSLLNGKLVVGCENGLYLLTTDGSKRITTYPVIGAYQAHDSSIWVGTRGYGLLKINNNFQIVKRYVANKSDPTSLTFDEVSCLYEDHSGVLWVGTYGRGLNKLDLRAKRFELYTNRPWEENSLSGDRVISFFEDSQEQLWIGLRGAGINILDTENKLKSLSDKTGTPFYGQSVSSFFEDPLGGLWVGTWGGGIVILPGNQISNLLHGDQPKFDTLLAGDYSVEKILEDHDGHVWLSTTNGLLQYIPGKANYYEGEFRTYGSKDAHAPLTDSFIRDIYVEKGDLAGEKVVWVGTRNGLNRLVIREFEHSVQQIKSNPSNPNSLPSDFISVIIKDQQDSLWVSCLGGGIAMMTAGRDGKSEVQFKVYNKENGFPNNEIETILEDDMGLFWMGGYGLTRFDPTTGHIVGFDLNDGLQSNDFKVWAAMKRRNGKFVFGGTKGFNIFRPAEITENEIPPKLAFTDIKLNNKDLSALNEASGYNISDSSILVTRQIELPYELNSFTISFAALHFTSPENNQLKFKLDGVDLDWLTLKGSESSRNYSQLKPGTYTFTFTGANSDNIWASEPLSLTITINKPFWATNYAIFLYVVVLLVLLFIFRKYSIVQVKEIGEIKLERMRKKQAEELNRLKINFYTEVSHELRTPLSLIKGPVFDILETQSLDAKDRKKLEVVGRNVERMTNLVDEIMLFTEYGREVVRIKATEGDIVKFVEEITLFFSAEAVGRNIDFRFESNQKEILLYFDRDKLEKVFFNLLSNAFKFTPNGGAIVTKAVVHPEQKTVEFSVFNTGKQIPEQDIDHIFERFYTNQSAQVEGHGIGLSVAYQIMAQHHGKIWVENMPNGVCFHLTLPAGKDHFESADVSSNFINSDNPVHYSQMENETKGFTVRVKNKTVLIVEDNTELRNYLSHYLSDHFKVLTATNGKVGLDQAIQHSPDIVISDLMMPEMDGLNMCRKLKTDIRTSHIPIIILTARTSLMQQIDGYEIGADAYVTKPFNAQLLLARIANLISSREKLRALIKNNVDFSPKEVTVTTIDEKIITQAIDTIEKYMEDSDFGVDKLCEEMGMSRSQLYRKIKALTSFSINEFIRLIRLKRAAQLLKQDNSSVAQVMHQVGFENQSFFSKVFKQQFGISPKQYKVKS